MALLKNITSGSINGIVITGSLDVSNGITGSLFGTASWALNAITASYFSGSVENAISASYALTASYALNGGSGGGGDISGSDFYVAVYSGSNALRTGSIFDSGSFTAIGATAPVDPSNPDRLFVDAGNTTSYNLISGHGEVDSYLQLNIQNFSPGSAASSDIVATADNGNETDFYIDMGINGSGYNDSQGIGAPNDAYLYNTGGDLLIGNTSSNKRVIIFNGGTPALDNARVYITQEGTVGINASNPNNLNPEALLVEPLSGSATNTFNNLIIGKGTINESYLQLNIINEGTGSLASSDIVATNDIGTESDYFIDMGINSSNYSTPNLVGGPNDAYLYSTGEHLHIGNASANQPIMFFAGGLDADATMKLQLGADNQHIMSGSLSITGSLNVLKGITGSLYGTASWAENVISASSTLTASYVNPLVQDVIITGSLLINGSQTLTGSLRLAISDTNTFTFSNTDNVLNYSTSNASYRRWTATNSSSSGSAAIGFLFYNDLNDLFQFYHGSSNNTSITPRQSMMRASGTGGLRLTADSGPIVFHAGSYGTERARFDTTGRLLIGLTTGSAGYLLEVNSGGRFTNNVLVTGSVTATTGFTGSLFGTASWAQNSINTISAISSSFAATASSADNFLVRGTLTAQTIVAQVITSSTEFVTGSTRFGSSLSNTHEFTGSVSITGSLTVFGNSSLTGSLFGTASNALTASYTPTLQQVTTAGNTTTNNVIISGSLITTGSISILSSSLSITNPVSGLTRVSTYRTDQINLQGTYVGIANNTDFILGSDLVIRTYGSINRTIIQNNAGITLTNYSGTGTNYLHAGANGVRIGGNDQTISARLHVSGSDQSLFLVNSAREGSVFYISGSGNTGIGTTSPIAKLHVSGAISEALLIVSSSAGPALFVSGSGNVGIGNANPSVPLEIGRLSGGIQAKLRLWSGGSQYVQLEGQDSILDFNLNGVYSAVLSRNGGQRFTLPSNSVLGWSSAAGTSTPVGANDTTLTRWSAGVVAVGSGSVANASGSLLATSIGIGAFTPSASLHILGAASAALLEIDSPTVNNILFVSGSGRVGIGTSTPTSTLHVVGTTNINGSTTITGSLNTSGSVNINSSGSAVFSVDGISGRLFQIDDSLSGSLFSVNTAAGLPIIEAFSDNTVRIGQFGQRAFFVSQSSVGIGKESNLNGKLDVSGSVFITGSLNVSSGITGSLFGTSSWAQNALTSSYVLNAISSSFADFAVSSSYPIAITGSTIYNSAFGTDLALTTNNAIALGYRAGEGSSAANASIMLGIYAGQYATNATDALFMFSDSGYYADNADNSIMIGTSAGSYSTNANNSTFLNTFAGYSAPEANNSFFAGQSSGQNATSASNSSFIGRAAGYNAYFANNSRFLGFRAGQSAASGSYSTLLGFHAGYASTEANTIGRNNIIIGTGISLPAGREDSINLGGIIFATGSYFTTTENTSFSGSLGNGRVGINVVNPTFTLDVSGSIRTTSGLTSTGSIAVQLGGGHTGFLEANGNTLRLRHISSGDHIFINANNTTTLLQVVTAQNALTVTPGSNSPTLGFSATVGAYPSAVIGRFISGSVTVLSLSGSGMVGTGSFNYLGNIAATSFTGSAAIISGSGTNRLTVIGSGSAQPIFTVQGSQGELFSITDSLSGSLFSVNDISGLPIVEVFSDNTMLMGSYLAPSLNTTVRATTTNSGSFTIYSVPTSSYDGLFMEYTARSGSNARAGQFMAIWSGSSVNFTDNSTTDFGNTTALSFTGSISGSNMTITGNVPTGSGWTVKSIIRSI